MITYELNKLGHILLKNDNDQDLYLQTDWDYPGIAECFGFVPCDKCGTDGTVDCEHKTASDMIDAAWEFLVEHEGEEVEDPGYFD